MVPVRVVVDSNLYFCTGIDDDNDDDDDDDDDDDNDDDYGDDDKFEYL